MLFNNQYSVLLIFTWCSYKQFLNIKKEKEEEKTALEFPALDKTINLEGEIETDQGLDGEDNEPRGDIEPEKEKPKAKLDVDVSTSQLLVTGPEFIFKKIQGVVLKLDKPELSEPPDFLLLNPAMDKEKVKATLKAIFGSKIEVKLSDEVGGQESGQNNATRNRTTSGNQDAASKAMAQGQDAARQAIMRAMQQRQTQQGGAQRGGGTQRGGGGQRGGGRGGR